MLDSLFLAKLVLSFFAGGIIISGSIWLGEKLGPKWAGLLIGLPTTSAVGLFFIGFTEGPKIASQAAQISPYVSAICFFYLLGFIALYQKWKKLISSIAIALGFWFLAAASLVYLNANQIWIGAGICFTTILIVIWIMRKVPNKIAIEKASKTEIVYRMVFAGTIIALAVILARYTGPLWGGVFGTFPAAYTSTMYLVTKKHGIEFTQSIVKNIPLGAAGLLAYVLMVHYMYPIYGIWIGTILAYGITLLLVGILSQIMKTKWFT
ncbi:MAG: hypothetical protein Q7S92_03070 [Candidatus Diapherotrites archaeon]|nr:hypothetical protein [Candidatus Diapherotrites archaeon]